MHSALIRSGRSYPAMPFARQLEHQRVVLPNPLVLGENLRNHPSPTSDRDRPVSRRSKPSSRTALIGEQPNPWDLLQPQDAMSRHRGAKPPRRYGLLGEISLLSPEYLLSDERRPFHMETAGSLSPAFTPARLMGLAVKHPCAFTLNMRLPTALRVPLDSSVTLWEETAPAKLPSKHCLVSGFTESRLGFKKSKSGISLMAPQEPKPSLQRLPPMLRMHNSKPIPAYSKGSRGLFVLARGCGIFTTTTISPSTSSRHHPCRYAFRAGRNLPDKEL